MLVPHSDLAPTEEPQPMEGNMFSNYFTFFRFDITNCVVVNMSDIEFCQLHQQKLRMLLKRRLLMIHRLHGLLGLLKTFRGPLLRSCTLMFSLLEVTNGMLICRLGF